MAIRQEILLNKAKYMDKSLFEEKQKLASLRRIKSGFLCHSHKDRTLVEGLIAIFQEEGLSLYIDWKDHTMPNVPDKVTAERIQDHIRTCDLFIFLASENSKASRWCPWEIGYADSSGKSIYILPTSNDSGTYGNEYLQLYPNIDMATSEHRKGYAVFQPDGKGIWLTDEAI